MSFWAELKRRKVFLVAAAYVPVALIVIALAVDVEEPLRLPEWTDSLVIVLVIIGFPIALVLAWALELTPEGIKRTPRSDSVTVKDEIKDVDPAAGLAAQSRKPGSIAVLPFENLSPAKDDEYFAAALHDEILTQLAKLSTLKVISRTSVMEYRKLTKNLRQIARELDVATILEGGVQKVGDMVRINVQLIDAETDEHRWAESYDRELTVQNLLAIQREMATSIAEALYGRLSSAEERSLAEVPTENTRAYNLYLAGNYYFEDSTGHDQTRLAIEMYESAVKEDPEFALAYARLARAHRRVYTARWDWTRARMERAEAALRRAVELDPDSADVWIAQALFEKEFEKEQDLLGRARKALPGKAHPIFALAMAHRRQGLWEKALELFELAAALDPRNSEVRFYKGVTHSFLRQCVEAREDFETVLAISPEEPVMFWVEPLSSLHWGGGVDAMKAAVEPPESERIGDVGRMWFRWLTALYERDYSAGIRCVDECNWDGESAFTQPQEYYPKDSLYGIMYRLGGMPQQARDRFEAARAHLEKQIESTPDDWRLQIALGEALVALDCPAEGIETACRGMKMSSGAIDEPFARIEATMRVFLPAKDYERAITELETYLSNPGLWTIEGLLPDPRLDPVRDDPRFAALVEKFKRR